MKRDLGSRFSMVLGTVVILFGVQLCARAQVVTDLSALWANQGQQAMVHMTTGNESNVLLYQTFWAVDEGGPYTRLGHLFAPVLENEHSYVMLYDSPVSATTPLFIMVRAFLNGSTTEDSQFVSVLDPAIESLGAGRVDGGQNLVVTLASGSEVHTVAFVILWSADPSGPFEILDGPFAPNFADYSLYTRLTSSPLQTGALYLKAQAILDDSTVEESQVTLALDPILPPIHRQRKLLKFPA